MLGLHYKQDDHNEFHRNYQRTTSYDSWRRQKASSPADIEGVVKRRRTAHDFLPVRAEDFVKKRSVKSGRRSMEAQSFDTQRHMAIDFNDSLEKISIMRSVGIGNAEPSLPLSEVF